MNLSFVSVPLLKFILLACSSTLLFGCKQQKENQAALQQKSAPAPVEEKRPALAQVDPFIALPDFEYLYPVELVNPKSKNIYEKYGIEFSGVCYACDLAEIRINPQEIDFINVCDNKDIARVTAFKYTIDEHRLIAEKEGQALIFTKIDAAPVYALEIIGAAFSFENKRIIKYYVPKKIIKRFKQHDCGDFQG